MKKSRKLHGMPIFSLNEGQQIGQVKGLVIDPKNIAVAALVIEQKGWFKDQRIIPFHHIKSIGDDAITVDKAEHAEKKSSMPSISTLIKEKYTLIGCKVVDESGTALGAIDEFYIDITSGKITVLEIAGKLVDTLFKGKGILPACEILTIGKDAVIVTAGSQGKLLKSESFLQDTVKTVKETTSQLWESTVTKTKEFGKNLTSSVAKLKGDKQKADEKNSPAQEKNEDMPESTSAIAADTVQENSVTQPDSQADTGKQPANKEEQP